MSGLMIFLSIIQSVNVFSQDIIVVDGKRYNDVDFTNKVIDERNEAILLLSEVKAQNTETIKVIETVIYEDKIVKEYIEKEETKKNWDDIFFSGTAGFVVGFIVACFVGYGISQTLKP